MPRHRSRLPQLDGGLFLSDGGIETDLIFNDGLELHAAGSFEAVASIQVLEYIDDVQRALEEMHRVLKPGGRLVNFATNWGALFWNSGDPARMKKMLGAWDLHAPHANLPAHLRALLTEVGFSAVSQSPVAMLNCHYDDRAYSYCLARIMAAFAAGRGLISVDEAQEWLADLAAADARNEYLFCSIAIVTRAAR